MGSRGPMLTEEPKPQLPGSNHPIRARHREAGHWCNAEPQEAE